MPRNTKYDVELFTEAIQLPSAERVAFLDRACAGDADLRARIEALLKFNDRAGDFLESPPTGTIQNVRDKVTSGEKPGDVVDRYRLVQQIGEGGCGIVFMAEQQSPVRRRVALKIIKPGMDTKSVIARFEAERQALALMDHPNIAKIFDAGTTESGRPYFVMELIEGAKITDYADQHLLTMEDRLKLFVQVCQAVQHAHQKGIIHRDIKPSNILVTATAQGDALPVVIDFGIAKATTNQPLTDKTLLTAVEMIIGTPAYMSPEQATLTSADVDTRTDIYSLGVLLYELLTGSTPFDAKDLLKAGFDEIRRVIREQDPMRPSTRLSKLTNADLTSVARRRKSEPPSLVRTLRGDLDWIVMKALEKDRARRYPTANGLALDVQRYVANEAVSARPPSKAYRFGKAVARNKILFGSVGAVAVLLVLSLIVVSISLSKERQASAKSQQVTKFLQNMLNGAGVLASHGVDTTLLQQILNDTAGQIEREMANQPVVEADLRNMIGKLSEQSGNYAQAEEMESAALSIRRRYFGPSSLEAAATLNDLGLAFMAQHKLPEAEKAHAEALAIRRRLLGDENPDTVTSLNDLAAVYRDQGKLAVAESMVREALRIRRKLFGQEHVDVADSLRNLSIILGGESRWDEAKKTAEVVLAMRRKLLGTDHPYVWDSLEDVAWAASGLGQLDEAERLDQEALMLRQKRFGDRHPNIGRNLNALGQLLGNRGDLTTADAVLKATLSIQSRLIGENQRETLETLFALGKVLDSEGKTTEAETVWQKAVSIWRKREDDNDLRLFTLRGLGDTLEHEAKWTEAEAIWRESLALWRKRRGTEDKESMYTLRRLGLALEAEHKWPEAESVHREALSISGKKGDDDPEALADLEKLTRVLTAERRFAEAQQLLDRVLAPSEAKPASVNLLILRVNILGRRGQWDKAAADATLALHSQPTEHYRYHTLAALLAMIGDRSGYERVCRQLVTRFTDPTDPFIAERIAQDCLLLPNSGADLAMMDKLADKAIAAGHGTDGFPFFLACKAMARFRLGDFSGAIDWGEKAVNSPANFAQAKAHAVLAMAHWQLGQSDEARSALAKGDALAPSISTSGSPEDLGESWVAWLMARISLDEATRLIEAGDKTPPL